MRYEARHPHAEHYVLHAFTATLFVVIIPVVVVWAVLALLDPDPHPLVTSALGFGLALAASGLGSVWWMRRPDSTEISFGELMLWSWLRRKRAEDRLDTSARALGLDDADIVIDSPLSPHEQFVLLKDLSAALESKDPYTHGHTRRVERYAYRTGLVLGLHAGELDDLRKAAVLHDVGKVRIPDRLLRKPSELTLEERVIVEGHVTVGAWMVGEVGNEHVVAGVRHHHERWDGSGYPLGLAGTDIPLFARIIAVADAYDAMTSTRPYRPGMGKDPAIDGLLQASGSQFDPQIVRAFIESLPRPVAVPLAGLFLVFAGPSRLFRRLAVGMKQIGATALAPAAGAAALMAVVSAGFAGLTPIAPNVLPNRAVAAASTDVQAPILPSSRRDRPDAVQTGPRRTQNALAPQVLGVRFSRDTTDAAGEIPGTGQVDSADPGQAPSGDSGNNSPGNDAPSGGEPPPANEEPPPSEGPSEGPTPSPSEQPPPPNETPPNDPPPNDPPPGDAGSEEPAPSDDSPADDDKNGNGHDKHRGEGHENHEGEGESDGNASDDNPPPDNGNGGGQP